MRIRRTSVARMALAAFVTYVVFGAAYAMLGPRLQELGLPSWSVVVLSLAVSVAMGGYVGRVLPATEASPERPARERKGDVATTMVAGESSMRAADEPTRAMITGAVIFGFLGFSIGFFGPMVFAPEANQGPLLGIFITGPLGAAVGSGAGWFWWATYRSSHSRR